MVNSIKGIANLAALSGSSAEQASGAMYQLSQAIAAGKVNAQDWNSVVNAGMAGTTFQRALAQTAVAMGKLDESQLKLQGDMKNVTIDGQSFKNSIMAKPGEESWLDSKVLTSTLAQFSNDLTDAQLKAQGFNDAQIAAIKQTAATAQQAATQVKTIKQVWDVAMESLGSGWAKSFQLIFGDFEEAKGSMTELSNFIGGGIKAVSHARNRMLAEWKNQGGRAVLIAGLVDGFKGLMTILNPFKEAFRDIFPVDAGQTLLKITDAFAKFMRSIAVGTETADRIHRIFAGLFAILDIGWQLIKGVASVFSDLFGVVSDGSGGFLELVAVVGDWLVALDKAIKKGDGLETFFSGLSSVLQVPLKIFGALGDALASMFGSASGDSASAGIDKMTGSLSPLAHILGVVKAAWEATMAIFAGAGRIMQPIIDAFGSLFDAVAEAFSGGNFNQVLDALNTGLLAVIALTIRKFFKSGLKIDFGGGVLSGLSGVFGELGDTLQALQTQIKAKSLMLIAGAIALLTASVVALSLINSAALTKALTAMSVGFGQLLGAMYVLEQIGPAALKTPMIASGMVLLAGAILVLSAAVAILAQLSWEELLKGLLGVTVLMAGLAGAANLMGKASGPMLRAGVAMLPLATSLLILAGAMKIMATMSWSEMAKGLVGIAGGLVIIAGAMQLMPKSLPLTAAGLVLVAAALNGIATSMAILATLSWEEIAKGLVAIAGSLLIITGVMKLMSKIPMASTAASLVLVSAALIGIATAAKIFATMSWEGLAKAGLAIAGSLFIIAGAMKVMETSLTGAAALVIVAAALNTLVPVLLALGTMDIMTIVQALIVLAGVFVLFGVASVALSEVIPLMIALGAAILILGAGIALLGGGLLAAATAMTIFVAAGSAGIAALIAAIMAFINALPQMVLGLGATLQAIATLIGQNVPAITEAFFQLLGAVLVAGTKLLPKIGTFISKLIQTILRVLVSYYSALANAGLQLLLNIINAFATHIGLIVTAATNLIINFVKALGRNGVKLANAGLTALVDFLNGLADAIRSHNQQLNAAGGNVASAIIEGLLAPIRNAGGLILGAIQDAWNWAKDNFTPHLSIGGHKVFRADANALTGSFAELVGGVEQQSQALEKIRSQIKANLDKASSDIDKWNQKLKELRSAKDKDPKAIKHAQEQLNEAKKLKEDAEAAEKQYKKQMKAHGDMLKNLASQYDKVKAAQAALDEQTKARADFVQSIADKFNTAPDIEASTSLASYMRQLAKRQAQVQKFQATLAALRAAGLSDEGIQQFINEGTDAQKVMDQLLAGGGGAIANFNAANAALAASATKIGDLAASVYKNAQGLTYDNAVAQAQNFLNGLTGGLTSEASLKQIEASMGAIARAMMKAIKKHLDIKSPSREAMKVSFFFVKGLTKQMDRMHGDVQKSSEALGNTALEALQASMSKVEDGVSAAIEMNPTISPVLDLTQLTKDANSISSLIAANPIQATMSLAQATDISLSKQASTDTTAAQPTVPTEFKYEQNIYSPKQVDAIETYRQAKSSIPLIKEALNIP